jgi:hypothetical protein
MGEVDQGWALGCGAPQSCRLAEADDLDVAFFGDLFRPPGAMSTDYPPHTEADLTLPLEAELLADLYAAAVEQDPTAGQPSGAMGVVKVAKNIMLERLLRTSTFGAVAKRAMIGNLKQVSLYLTDAEVKQDVLARVASPRRADSMSSPMAFEGSGHRVSG